MPDYRVNATADIAARADKIYGLIADYRSGHPRILPRPPFGDLQVEAGGVGAGTVIRFEMRAFGATNTVRARITEPEPGRILQETDLAGRFITTFTVEPLTPDRTRVTIATTARSPSGLKGMIERALSRRFLHATFRRELAQLARVATGA